MGKSVAAAGTRVGGAGLIEPGATSEGDISEYGLSSFSDDCGWKLSSSGRPFRRFLRNVWESP